MSNSIHIFTQIDTQKLVALYKANGHKNPTNEEVRACTIICRQGSLSVGSAIQRFQIEVKAPQDLHFCIIPLDLMGYHKVYFTSFKVRKQSKIKLKDKKIDNHGLSFKVDIKEAQKDGEANFDLNGIVEYEDEKGVHRFPICIDPKIRVMQGG